MLFRFAPNFPVLLSCLLLAGTQVVADDELDLPHAHQSIAKAITFLQEDAVKWRKERNCATCHHGIMTVWALAEANYQGYSVDPPTFSEVTRWTMDRFRPRLKVPRDSRPGWNLVSLPAIYLGVMSQNLPVLSRDEMHQVAVHLARHQEADGAWLLPPPTNSFPPTNESRETLASLALLAWEPYTSTDPSFTAADIDGRHKATLWLAQNPQSNTTQSLALRLVLGLRSNQSTEQIEIARNALLVRQNADGGWSQVDDFGSDAYATGQALWALSFTDIDMKRPEITRAVSFLIKNQQDNGSWPMKQRQHAENPSTRERLPIPITYFGSAWGTLGLLRTVPAPFDPAERHKAALDQITLYQGKHLVDEADAAKPVISVELRQYEMSDAELKELVTLFQVFPKLAKLQLKSDKITDKGLPYLKYLTQLESLELAGTNISDAAIEALQKTLPETKISRGG